VITRSGTSYLKLKTVILSIAVIIAPELCSDSLFVLTLSVLSFFHGLLLMLLPCFCWWGFIILTLESQFLEDRYIGYSLTVDEQGNAFPEQMADNLQDAVNGESG
jgi:hypothetical protein